MTLFGLCFTIHELRVQKGLFLTLVSQNKPFEIFMYFSSCVVYDHFPEPTTCLILRLQINPTHKIG